MRPAVKIVLGITACAVVLFLLLPFLETQAPSQTEDGKKASPQLFNANPLTALANKLASFFGIQTAAQRRAARARDAQAENAPLPPEQAAPLYAAVRPGDNSAARQDASAKNGADNPRYDYGDAAVQNAEGDWVLVRQTAPSGQAQGMHEVNVTDNAYDRYIRQERAARYTPAEGVKRTEVPDSKWARLFRPIKRLFKSGDAQNAGGGLRIESSGEESLRSSAVLASSQGFGRNRTADTGSAPARPAIEDIYNFTPSSRSGGRDRDNPLRTLLNPESVFEQQAKAYADQVYPNPQTDEEKKQKQDLIDQGIRDQKEQFKNLIEAQLAQDMSQSKPEDLLPQTLGCKDASALYDEPRQCPPRGQENQEDGFFGDGFSQMSLTTLPAGPADGQKQQIEQQMQASRQALAQRLGVQELSPDAVEKTKVLVVLGKVGDESTAWIDQNVQSPQNNIGNINSDGEALDEQTARNIYTRLLEEKCQKQDCFWVANNSTTNERPLQDSVAASGLSFAHGVAQNLPFIEEVKQELLNNDELLDSDVDDVKLMQLLNNPLGALPYIPVTSEELQGIYDDTRAHIQAQDGDITMFFAANAHAAQDINNVVGSPFATFYDNTRTGEDGTGIFHKQTFNAAHAGQVINQSLLNRFDQFYHLNRQHNQQKVQDYVGTQVQQQAQAIKEELGAQPAAKK